ncbi:MAG: hypothetical protein J6L00_00605 [Clostridia bacterium]|nr:hypothetical protein [Clostridia bacterium]
MEHLIKSANFDIRLQLKVFDEDIEYSSNTILTISVNSDGFCASTDMDIDIKQFVAFVDALSSLYSSLTGSAVIQEPYGEQQFIEFCTDRSGNISIRGELSSNGRKGFMQKLTFENCIDQTYLPEFVNSLTLCCAKYR